MHATFYRHFRDKYDLIAWDYVSNTARIMQKIGKDGYVWRHTLLDAAVYYQEHRDYLRNLLNHTSGRDAFVRHMAAINIDLLVKEVQKSFWGKTLPGDIMLLIKAYCYGMVELSCEWISGGVEASADYMASVYERALPGELKAYLYE